MSEDKVWECEDTFGNITKAEPEALVATDWDGYLIMEKYIDSKEARVRQLEREIAQCQKAN